MQKIVGNGPVVRPPPAAQGSVQPALSRVADEPRPQRLRPAYGVLLAVGGGAAIWALIGMAAVLLWR